MLKTPDLSVYLGGEVFIGKIWDERGRKIMEYQVGWDLTELLRKSNNSNSTQIGNAK